MKNILLTPKFKQRSEDTNKRHQAEYPAGTKVANLFIGDSMMERMLTTGVDHWRHLEGGAANLGVGGDGVEHLLYRLCLERSVLTNISAKRIHLMIGTNNLNTKRTPKEIAEAVSEVIWVIRSQSPQSEIVVYELPYRTEVLKARVDEVNAAIREIIGKRAEYVPLCDLLETATDYDDTVHLNASGYSKWFSRITLQN